MVFRSVLAGLAVLSWSFSARAQEAPAPPAAFQAIGYVVNAPTQLAGIQFVNVRRGGLGWFADLKLTVFLEPDGDIYYDVPRSAVEAAGDPLRQERASRNSLNGGVTLGLTDRAFVYAGVGAQQRTRYLRYENASRRIARAGTEYWITDQGFGVNALGGVGYRVHRYVTVVLGAELEPRGVTVGVGYTMPAARARGTRGGRR